MSSRRKEMRKNRRIWAARGLIAAMLGLSFSTLSPYQTSAAQAFPTELSEPGIFYQDDVWEKLENNGEVIVSFPCVLDADISSPEDEDAYTFRLESRSDLTLTLESEYPCTMELLHQGQVIGSSSYLYSQILEPIGLEEGDYTVRIRPQEHVEESCYQLRITKQANRTKQPDYSEAHMAGTMFDPKSPFRMLNISKESEKNRGGNTMTAAHYLAHWQGPVNEAVMPYYDKGDLQEIPSDYIHYKKATPNFHTQNVFFLPPDRGDGSHMEHWKNAIMTYGAVNTIFLPFRACYSPGIQVSDIPWYEYEYFYAPPGYVDGETVPHAILIVGWDDTIAKENFRVTRQDEDGNVVEETMPQQDGAWICKNSYSGIYPDYFYVSYESGYFGIASFIPAAFAPPEQNDNYNHMYSNTAGGMIDGGTGNAGFLRGVQVFQNEGESELLRAVGFSVKYGEISYEIGVRIGDGPLERVKTGYLKYPGFYTARLDQGITIPAGSKFEIHVALSSNENKIVVFNTYMNVDGRINGVKEIPGKSYYYTGWEDESECMDASAKGEYPYICAYTYAPENQGITILDNREAPGEIEDDTHPEPGRATASDADRAMDSDADRTADPEPGLATSSDADRVVDSKMDRATASDADKSTDPETDMDYAESEDDAALFDDLLLIDQTETKEQSREEKALRIQKLQSSRDGAMPNEEADDIEVKPLNLHFPEKYDSRSLGLVTKSKNQGNSSLCWAFAAAGALETSYLRYGNQMIDYPKGLNIISEDAPIIDGTITLKLKKGEALPLNLMAMLYSDSQQFNPGTPQIYWEISGDLSSIQEGQQLSESGERITALEALAPGRVTVTAISMADVSLKASCHIEIMETAPAKVRIEPETLNLWMGETRQLKTTVESGEALTVIYTSDKPEIASVDKNGRVIALKPGKAVITAKAGDGQAVCTVYVSRPSSFDDGGGIWTVPAAPTPGPSLPDTVSGNWEQMGEQWRFKKADGTYAVSSWERIGGLWYYFKEDAFSAIGWRYDPAYQKWFFLETSGAMTVGWKEIEGKWYYFHTISDGEMGKMYTGERTPDGYMVGADGAWVP